MDLRELEAFLAVVETGGIGRAAVRLHRAQSSITSRIHQLESSLGVTLFHRESQRLRLTGAGETLVDHAHRMLELAEQTRAAVCSDEVGSKIRLGAMESIAASRLPYPLAQFHRRYPKVWVNIETTSSRGLVADVQAGALDAAIVGEEVDAARFRSVPLYEEELVLVGARDSTMLQEPQRLAAGAVLVYHKPGCAYRKRFEQWLESQHIVPMHVLEFASYHGMFAAAAGGVGVGMLPRSVLEVFPQKRVLSVREIAPRLARLKTFLVTSRHRHQPSLARLEECLREDAASQRTRGGRASAKATGKVDSR
ncbi:MAG: LysR substrate-binding domain-containing protein [Rhodanobacter sp.]